MSASVSRALVLEEPRRLVDRQFPRPELGDDDGLLRVEACGRCGTDHEQFTGTLPGGFAFVPGHETVAVIEAVGPAAAERRGVVEGDRVAVEVFAAATSMTPAPRSSPPGLDSAQVEAMVRRYLSRLARRMRRWAWPSLPSSSCSPSSRRSTTRACTSRPPALAAPDRPPVAAARWFTVSDPNTWGTPHTQLQC